MIFFSKMNSREKTVAWLGMRMVGEKEHIHKQSISFFHVVMADAYVPTKNCLYHSEVLSACELWFSSSEIKLFHLGLA